MSEKIHRWLPGDELKPLRNMYKALEAHLLQGCEYCTVYGQYCCIISEHSSKYQFLRHLEDVTKVHRDVDKMLMELHKKRVIQYDEVTSTKFSILFLKMK